MSCLKIHLKVFEEFLYSEVCTAVKVSSIVVKITAKFITTATTTD